MSYLLNDQEASLLSLIQETDHIALSKEWETEDIESSGNEKLKLQVMNPLDLLVESREQWKEISSSIIASLAIEHP
ncbi:hypothetical protein STEG23_029975 [Scotinomys teguina]